MAYLPSSWYDQLLDVVNRGRICTKLDAQLSSSDVSDTAADNLP